MDYHINEICELVKPGNKVLVFQEGYSCSNCKSQLNEEEASWHYCNYCLINFDCCEEMDEPCETCGPKVEELVLKTYKTLPMNPNKI